MQTIKFFTLILSFVFSYFYSLHRIEKNCISGIHFSADSVITIKIAVVGDLMCHSPQFNYARVNKDSFDFNPVYRFVKHYLKNADFTFGNLETVIGREGSRYSGYPRFNSPSEYITALSENGFDFVCFANNHTLDQGEKGIYSTIESLSKNKIGYTGAFNSEKDKDSIRILDIKGMRIAILAYSYGTNGSIIPKGKEYLINLIDLDSIRKDIWKARERGAEIVLVNYHFGSEYQRFPSEYQKEVVRRTIEFGADLITASHPHVIQPIEYFKTNDASLDSGIVAYSLGNFISNQRNRYTDAGIILYLNMEKNLITEKINLASVEYIPTWVFKGKSERVNEFIILPVNREFVSDTLSFLNEFDRNKINQARTDTKEIINKFSDKTKLFSN